MWKCAAYQNLTAKSTKWIQLVISSTIQRMGVSLNQHPIQLNIILQEFEMSGRVGSWPSIYFWQSIDYWFSPDSDVNLENTLNCHATGDDRIFENMFSGRRMVRHLGFVPGFVQSGQSGLSHVLRKESTSTRTRLKGLFRFLKINS